MDEKKIRTTTGQISTETHMMISNPELRSGRRHFLSRWKALTLAGFSFSPFAVTMPQFVNALSPSQAAHTGEKRPGLPAPPPSADPDAQDQNAPEGVDPQTSKRIMAAKNEKEFREGVEKLYQMATELRDELAQAPKMNVLSVRMYKKTEEIEKLAKQLKSKAKGG
jgi:hypothetical protein